MSNDLIARFLDEQYVISELPYLDPGDVVKLSGVSYKITESVYDLSLLPDGFYYKATGSNGEKFLIKFLFKFKSPSAEPKPVAHTLLSELSHPSMAVPVEFATGIKKYGFKYCYEIYEMKSDFYTLLNVELSPSAVRKALLPQVKSLLEYLHANDIYLPYLHLSNFFVTPGTSPRIVLAGYGHALMKSKFPVVDKTPLSKTNLGRFFYSPEIAEGQYSETSDYYSFGMILMRLFYPEVFDQELYQDILRNGEELKPLIDYKTELYEVNTIIEGLTLKEELNRFSSADLDDLIAGRKVVPLYYGTFFMLRDDLGDEKLHNIGDLVELLKTQAERFLKYVRVPVNLKALTDWFNNLEGVKDISGLKKRFIRYQNIQPDYFIEIILRHLLPSHKINLNSIDFDFTSTEEAANTIALYFRNLEHNYFYYKDQDIKIDLFRFLLACHELSEVEPVKYNHLKDVLDRSLALLSVNPASFIDSFSAKSLVISPANWARLFHEFIPQKFFRSFEGTKIQKIEDFAFYLAQHPEVLSDEFHFYDMYKFLAWNGISEVKGKTYKELVFEILDARVECDIAIARIEETEPGRYKMVYSYRYSLTNYFKSLGEELPFSTEIKQQHIFVFKKMGFRSTGKVFKLLIEHLREEHDLQIEKITEETTKMLQEQLNGVLKTEIKWQTILVNILIIGGLGYLISAYGIDLALDEKTRWYLSLMPATSFFLYDIFPYLFIFAFILMLLSLSQNLKLIGGLAFLAVALSVGGTWYSYDSAVTGIDRMIDMKRAVLSELYRGTSTLSKPVVIPPTEILTFFDYALGKSNTDLNPLIGYSATADEFSVSSSVRVFARTLRKLEDGSYAAKFEPVDDESAGEKRVASIAIPDNSGFLNTSGFFAFKMKIDDISIKGGPASVFGIAFNHFYLIITPNYARLIKKSVPPEDRSDELLILSEMKNFDYTIEASGSTRDVEPAGIVERVFADTEIARGEVSVGEEKFDLEVSALFSTISVKINGKEVILAKNKSGFTDLDYEEFKPAISILVGAKSVYSFGMVSISAITDPTTERNTLAKKDLKCKPSQAAAFFTDAQLSQKASANPGPKEELVVTGMIGDAIQLETGSGLWVYLNKKDVEDIFF